MCARKGSKQSEKELEWLRMRLGRSWRKDTCRRDWLINDLNAKTVKVSLKAFPFKLYKGLERISSRRKRNRRSRRSENGEAFEL